MINSCLIILILFILSFLTKTDFPQADRSTQLLSFSFTNTLRGIAILLIMSGHVSGTMHTVAFTPFGGIGVALFLMLSGYGLNESYKKHGLKDFWKKKILRVLLPYSFVFVALACYEHNYSPTYWILNLIGLKTAYWYIAFIVKCYIMFWVVSALVPRHRILAMFAISALLFAAGSALESSQGLSFIVGILISTHKSTIVNLQPRNIRIILIVSFVFGTIALAVKQIPYIREVFMDTLIYDTIQMCINIPYAISITSLLAIFIGFTNSRFLLLSGTISYELYLVHFPFYPSLEGNMLYVTVFFIGSYAAAWLYHKFISFIDSKISYRLQKP